MIQKKRSVGISFVIYSFGGEYCGLVSQVSQNIVCQPEECMRKKTYVVVIQIRAHVNSQGSAVCSHRLSLYINLPD